VTHVVVAGYGMAGARLAGEVRRRDPDARRVTLTVLGEEPHRAYNRVMLPTVVAGSLPSEALFLHEPAWPQRSHVDLRTGVTVAAVDRAARRVTLSDGSTTGYDALVLATGSRARVPPVSGLRTDDGELAAGVVAFRNLADCARICELTAAGVRVAVLGGGLLGIETARAVAGRGNPVSVVHPRARLMERHLDAEAGRVLARTLESLGVEVRLGAAAVRYLPGDGLKLDDGSHVPADLVVVCAGASPDTALARRAGLAVDRGVVVDDALRTSDARVHALGDCAQHTGAPRGVVQPAWDQAAVLADLLTGADPSARYRGSSPVVRLKAVDVDLATLGDAHDHPDRGDHEVVRVADPARGRYGKLVLHQDRVVGAILLGIPDATASITHYYDNRTPVPGDPLAVLLGRALSQAGAAPLPELTATVCRCNNVTREALERAWRRGARSTADLAERTRATTGCGGCADVVDRITERLARTP
jgi:assimilatory nitrate reductase electron transfer subunit